VFKDLHAWGKLPPGTRVEKMISLFPRIQPAAGAEAAQTDPPAAAPAAVAGAAQIEYADFQKVQLRTAKVLEAVRVDGADKLLRLQIDVGGETRQIVAGIAQHYKPEDLVGKTIVVVANLKPARIRGIDSNGMLLAASGAGAMRLVIVDGGELPSGSVVK
jgi:methionyl-tRNA synthetase